MFLGAALCLASPLLLELVFIYFFIPIITRPLFRKARYALCNYNSTILPIPILKQLLLYSTPSQQPFRKVGRASLATTDVAKPPLQALLHGSLNLIQEILHQHSFQFTVRKIALSFPIIFLILPMIGVARDGQSKKHSRLKMTGFGVSIHFQAVNKSVFK